ncbi:Uncharacterised protein [Mycobacteroides abscessus subsp. abscessus]|nr:Uncharacterised protein [Mycobacteroides abscessus subsp. abscessus]
MPVRTVTMRVPAPSPANAARSQRATTSERKSAVGGGGLVSVSVSSSRFFP